MYHLYSISTPHTTFSNPTNSFSVLCVGQELGPHAAPSQAQPCRPFPH